MENTAKLYILGCAAVVISGVKLEDWKTVEKYAPEALKIVDEDGETVFRIMTSDGPGSINQYGVVFGEAVNEDGCATVTVIIDPEIENKREAVMDIAGSALSDLIDIEKEMPKLLEEIRNKKDEISTHMVQM